MTSVCSLCSTSPDNAIALLLVPRSMPTEPMVHGKCYFVAAEDDYEDRDNCAGGCQLAIIQVRPRREQLLAVGRR